MSNIDKNGENNTDYFFFFFNMYSIDESIEIVFTNILIKNILIQYFIMQTGQRKNYAQHDFNITF